MKRFLVYPLCLMPIGAWAATTFYYDVAGVCDGLFLNPNASLCTEAVSVVTVPTRASKTFGGYYIGDTKVIDNNGNILVDRSAASSVFNTAASLGTNVAHALPQYTQMGQTLVKHNDKWPDYHQGWYTCSTINWQNCNNGGDFVLPSAPYCWSSGTNPQNTGYDYVFNSWRTSNNKFYSASTTWAPNYPDGVGTGSNVINVGCTSAYLGPITNDISDNKVYPFACRLFPGTRDGTWSTTKSVDHGTITLDNSVPGYCTYNLQCDQGYHIIGIGDYTCSGTNCRNFSLDSLDLGSCVVDDTPAFTCPTVPSWSQYGTVTRTVGTDSCTYALDCDEHFMLYNANNQVSQLTSLTCNGNDCTDDWLPGVLSDYSCRIKLPTKDEVNNELSELDDHLRVIGVAEWPYEDYDKYLYNLACTDNYTLNPPSGNSTISGYRTASQVANSISTNFDCVAPAFTCPDVPSNWSQYGTVTRTVGTNSCTYTLNCNDDFNLYNRDNQTSNPQIITCNGNDCTDEWLSGVLLNYSCKLNCPTVDGFIPTHDNGDNRCTYTIPCDELFGDNYDLYRNGIKIADHTRLICEYNSSEPCTYENINNRLEEHSCRVHCPSRNELNTELAGMDNLTVTGVESWPNNDYERCNFTLGCTNNYTLDYGNTSGPNCVGSGCTLASVISSITSQYRCVAPTCPDASSFEHGDHVVISNYNLDDVTSCHYNVECDSAYELYQGDSFRYDPFSVTCNANIGCPQTMFSDYRCIIRCPVSVSNGDVKAGLSKRTLDTCSYNISCQYTGQTLTGTPNPMNVPRTGSTSDIENNVNQLLLWYSCD